MKKLILSLLFIAVSFSATSCGSLHVVNPVDDTRSLVFGVIDMEKRPLHWVTIKQYRPKTDKPYWGAAAVEKSGIFWHSQLPPGKYQVTEFGGMSGNTRYTFGLGEDGENETSFRLKKGGGLYFIGSFKHERVKTSLMKKIFIGETKFNFNKSKEPTELEALTLLLPYATKTVWQHRIVKRIEKLGGTVHDKYKVE